MKHSNSLDHSGLQSSGHNNIFKRRGSGWCAMLAIIVPLVLIIPNVVLSITEHMGVWGGLANILLPLGIFGLLITISRRTGISALWFVPLMVLSAFQIVLLFLYGESLIAVDMFLNVVTTNPREVGELLGNLLSAIFTVVIVYLPVIVIAVIAAIKRWRLSRSLQLIYRRIAASVTFIGIIGLMIAYIINQGFSISRDIFPVNGLTNLGIAVQRSMDMADYEATSASWKYDGRSERADSLPETYILVIGETTRADNWQLAGYGRETNPQLSQVEGITFFTKALTQSNTTHKSVPMLLSSLTADDFADINQRKGLITAFNEAGFATYFFSNQRRNHSYIDHFGEEASTSIFIKDDDKEHFDRELLPLISETFADSLHLKKLIVVHSYGSHFNYRDRYPDQFSHFTPDNVVDANEGNRQQLINAYDNTVRYVDSFLADIDGQLRRSGQVGALIYVSDHGEDIFDDYRGRFLHASPTPTYTQLHVPMLVAVTPAHVDSFPSMAKALNANSGRYVASSAAIFHTLLQIAGVNARGYDQSQSVASDNYSEPQPKYLTDRNEAVALRQSGVKPIDIEHLDSLGIPQ